MITNAPSILIYIHESNKTLLRDICDGIEEEGVLYEVIEKSDEDAAALAYDAANESVLGSGIGISGMTAVMQMRNISKGRPIFTINREDRHAARLLGTNSARAVKKMPFKG